MSTQNALLTILTEKINNDSLINIQDVVVCINIVLGFTPEVLAADINGDGSVNIQDIITLINIILN